MRIKTAAIITTLAATTSVLGATVATPAQAAHAGQRICNKSERPWVDIRVARTGSRIKPTVCMIIRTDDRIAVLAPSFRTRASMTSGSWGPCKTGNVYYNPTNNYVRGYAFENCVDGI